MKWKITRQFMAALLITLLISVFSFMVFNVLLFMLGPGVAKELSDLSDIARDFTLNFKKYIQWENNQVSISKQGIKKLNENNLWIQVLDENSNEIYSCFKPQHVPIHYSAGRLIHYHRYSGNLKGYTIFVGLTERGNKELSYIIGFPENRVSKMTFSYNPQTIVGDIFKLLLGTVVVTLLVASAIGYIFSSRLADPIVRIVQRIKELTQKNYSKKYFEKGLYADVFSNLNNLSDTLRLNEKEMKKTEQMRKEWIENITHDLNTPLASIKGYSEMLLDPEYDLSSDEISKYAGIILDKANYISKLVKDLKLTYQLKHSFTHLEKDEQNLTDILRETIIDILNNPNYENANINFNPQDEVVLIQGNDVLLQRAFSNIIYNAVIHNPPGTTIDVSISKSDNINIKIEDNGRGMEEEVLKSLFERYYRGTNTRESEKGSGLGMAIAKQIIEIHGGSIDVSSKVGQGTKVNIHFHK